LLEVSGVNQAEEKKNTLLKCKPNLGGKDFIDETSRKAISKAVMAKRKALERLFLLEPGKGRVEAN
jgi:hypothetical protein